MALLLIASAHGPTPLLQKKLPGGTLVATTTGTLPVMTCVRLPAASTRNTFTLMLALTLALAARNPASMC
jgi:hypothetical protein